MGFTYVDVRIANPLIRKMSDEVNLPVDSRTIFTSIPRDILEKLGLRPVDRETLKVYGGTIVESDIGWSPIEYEDKRRVVPVIFSEKEDTSILRATGLETLGYQLDPITRKLKPVELLMI